ncbi:cell division protein ZapA [Dokdonella sp.]|uniref:cell division protein ZapA n=1 Tax=Dokdonella sp. TaxID=2291710 RepID=UPI001B114A5A|nr:cell division protein ZapA [Dokdonella sp.]MBO9662148.1 cell division protein ZapA [Dokdonella sp.]
MSGSEPVAVNILDREFLIACTPEEREGLLTAARYLDGKMREMRNNARTATLDRIAILAALNISHELLGARQREASDSAQLAEKLQAMHAKLERAFPGSLQ